MSERVELQLRPSKLEDAIELREWLMDPAAAAHFPMLDQAEIDDATNRWVGFCRYRCSLTAIEGGNPVGMSTLYLQPYRKLMHQSEFGIIVAPNRRGRGIGSLLLQGLIDLAKRDFSIELLHLQVYAGNPAIRLYERWGFREFGRQDHWIKEPSGAYQARIFMELNLI